MIAAIITTLDNAPILRLQLQVLRRDLAPYDHRIVVVDNGSIDDSRGLLEAETGLTVIHRENRGAGPGRNAGLDAVPDADHFFLLDGGILPMVHSIPVMLDYLERHPGTDVIAPPWEAFVTERGLATRRLPCIDESSVYCRWDLSMTAYCMARRRAFDPHRFSEEGPFGEPGWGVDDNEMAARWWRAGIVVEVFQNGAPLRRASGSFRRLYRETGIWPNQYGSVYEKRLVKYMQDYPDHWNNGIDESLLIPSAGCWQDIARLIIEYRRQARTSRHEILVIPDGSPETEEFVYRHALRQHHGDTTIGSDGTIVRRDPSNEATWCGNFRVANSLEDALAKTFQKGSVMLGDPARRAWRPLTPLMGPHQVIGSTGA